MHERLIEDSTATYRALLALFCDAEGGDAIRSRTVGSGERPGFPEMTAAKTNAGKAVAAELSNFRKWLGEQPSAVVAAIEFGVAKVVALLQHAPRSPLAERATGPFSTGPWDDVRVRLCELSTPPQQMLSDELVPRKQRSDFVCLVLEDRIEDKIGFTVWLHGWGIALREHSSPQRATGPRVAAVGNDLGTRFTDALEERCVLVIDRDRGNFDASPATAVRQKLAWAAGTAKRLALSQIPLAPGLALPGIPPTGVPQSKPAVDPAYEAFPAHVARAEFDGWIRELMRSSDPSPEPD